MRINMFLLSFFCLCFFKVHPQSSLNTNQSNIAHSVSAYFAMDRENIHLHLNKKIYLTNEQIWFKGYIIEKKLKPTLSTSNVYVSVFDSDGNKIFSQLYYAENSVFEGRIKLNKAFLSGKYYLQAYTNFMNNFAENESSVYEITILNNADKSYKGNPDINYESVDASYFPESGVFLEGTSNTVGIKIVDCNGIGMTLNGEISDSDNNLISNFTTNDFGYGKFDINNTELKNYKIKFTASGRKIEKAMPLPKSTGISFSIVNYAFPNKIIVKLKTNAATLEQIKNRPYDLVFQQNEKTVFVPLSFQDNLEQTLTILSSDIPDGVVAVYLIDQNLKKVGERMIYNPVGNTNQTLLNVVKKDANIIDITGSSPVLSGSISISVLPENTVVKTESKSIQADLLFNNYLLYPFKNPDYYLTDFSRKKHYELDNFLLSEKSKYDWDTMLLSKPEKHFDFDAGLTIKGTMNAEMKNRKNIQINMKSLVLGINEYSRLNDKNEFLFEHILAQDSTKIYFLAIDDRVKKPEIKVYSQLLNNVRMFMKPLEINKGCNVSNGAQNIPFPKIENAIMIDSITIASKKNKLVHENQFGNRISHGYKISDADAASNRDVLSFISKNGFDVSIYQGSVYIKSFKGSNVIVTRSSDPYRIPNPLIGGPSVSIDGMLLQNYEMLRDYSLSRVDEIYINTSGFDVANRETRGSIQIYSKANSGAASNSFKKSEALTVRNGFQGYMPFVNPKYDSTKDDGFLKLGTIDWKPFVDTDENGTFHFSISNLYQKSVRFVIEGMSPDGRMVSEIVKVDMN